MLMSQDTGLKQFPNNNKICRCKAAIYYATGFQNVTVLKTAETRSYKNINTKQYACTNSQKYYIHIKKFTLQFQVFWDVRDCVTGSSSSHFKAPGNFIFKIKHSQFLLGRLTPRMNTLQSFKLLTQ